MGSRIVTQDDLNSALRGCAVIGVYVLIAVLFIAVSLSRFQISQVVADAVSEYLLVCAIDESYTAYWNDEPLADPLVAIPSDVDIHKLSLVKDSANKSVYIYDNAGYPVLSIDRIQSVPTEAST